MKHEIFENLVDEIERYAAGLDRILPRTECYVTDEMYLKDVCKTYFLDKFNGEAVVQTVVKLNIAIKAAKQSFDDLSMTDGGGNAEDVYVKLTVAQKISSSARQAVTISAFVSFIQILKGAVQRREAQQLQEKSRTMQIPLSLRKELANIIGKAAGAPPPKRLKSGADAVADTASHT